MQRRERLEKALHEIRKEEFVQTLSPNHIVGFTVPVYKNKQVIASLSIFLPESRFTQTHKAKIRRTAKEIKERLEKETDL